MFVCVCVCVWAEGEDEIMGFHSATGGRGRHEYTEKAQGKVRWLDNKKEQEAGVNMSDAYGDCKALLIRSYGVKPSSFTYHIFCHSTKFLQDLDTKL